MHKEYKNICQQIKELEEKKKILGKQILEDMIKRHEKREYTEYGTFTVGIRKKYHYSDEVKNMAEEIKVMEQELKGIKLKEEATADWDESPYLMHKS